MYARGLKEGVGAASHAPIVQLRAVPVDRVLPAVGAQILCERNKPWVLLSQGGDVGLVAVLRPASMLPPSLSSFHRLCHLKRTHVRFKVRG
jgi:hypothetical protein